MFAIAVVAAVHSVYVGGSCELLWHVKLYCRVRLVLPGDFDNLAVHFSAVGSVTCLESIESSTVRHFIYLYDLTRTFQVCWV